jgi:hypothetical protein
MGSLLSRTFGGYSIRRVVLCITVSDCLLNGATEKNISNKNIFAILQKNKLKENYY